MQKFRIGDLIVGKDSSDDMYRVTNKKHKFIGKVKKICGFGEIRVEIISSEPSYSIGDEYTVESKYFDFFNDNTYTIEKIKEMGLL